MANQGFIAKADNFSNLACYGMYIKYMKRVKVNAKTHLQRLYEEPFLGGRDEVL